MPAQACFTNGEAHGDVCGDDERGQCVGFFASRIMRPRLDDGLGSNGDSRSAGT